MNPAKETSNHTDDVINIPEDHPEVIKPHQKDSAKKRESNKDIDVLRLYFKEMGEVQKMTAEEEAETWQKIDNCLQNARYALYHFGFIFKEHLRILSDSEMEDLSEIFPIDPENPMENFSLDSKKRTEWHNEISLIYEKLTLLSDHAKTSDKYRNLREKGIQTLLKYPALPVQIMEWHDVALRYHQLFLEGAISPEELENKVLCSVQEFETQLKQTTQYREEFEQWKLKMLETNLRLVINIAKHYQNKGLPLSDLIQEGNLGLMKALDKFNYKLGHRFCTYASWWIKQGVARALSGQSRIIRLPIHMIATIRKMHIAEQNFIQANGRDPEDQDIAKILDMSVAKIRAIRKMSVQCFSLQAPLNEESNDTFENYISDQQVESPMKTYARKVLRQRLEEALQQLSERQRQVISMRYGLDGGPCKSLTEVSETFHITRERVRQIELKTLDKLRKQADPNTYLDDIFL